MENNRCRNCAHYHQHYALDQRKIFRVYCGHCMQRNTKMRYPDSKVCDAFVPKPPDEDAFATKEYLSKELLRFFVEAGTVAANWERSVKRPEISISTLKKDEWIKPDILLLKNAHLWCELRYRT